jgi:hypothetical protein
VAAVTAAPKAAEHGDLAGNVRGAQERIARAIRVGEMRGDPLCDVLEAISTSLGVQLQLHEAAAERAQLPVDPAALVRLEKAAATGADRRAAGLARAHNWRTVSIATAVLIGGIVAGAAGGYWAGRHSQIATGAGIAAAAFLDGPTAADAWLRLMLANDVRLMLNTCTGPAVVAVGGRRACGVGVWLDPAANPPPRTERVGG